MRLVENTAPEVSFFLVNGGILKNIPELVSALKEMPDETYNYHVTKEKNDFANWIRDIYKNEELANKLFKAKNKKEVIKILEKALVEEEKELKKKQKEEKKEGIKKIEPPKKRSEILKLLKV
ncbi:MAG: hypothetical protein QW273_00810 [Candidatus Pacearchaeota archaeon]